MNREEYMRRLADALDGVEQSEKEEAIKYYSDYFDDAGAEAMQEAMNSLGSPERLAESIKQEQGCGQQNSGKTDSYQEDVYMGTSGSTEKEEKKNKLSGGLIALIVVLAVLASPIIIIITSGVTGGVVEGFEVILEVIAGALVSIVALLYIIIACFMAAVSIGATSPFGAVLLAGIGVCLAGLWVFLMMGVVWLFGVALPWLVKKVINLCKKAFGKKGEEL